MEEQETQGLSGASPALEPRSGVSDFEIKVVDNN
jgi:hypothetical protein